MFRKFASRLAAALSLATPHEQQRIADGLNKAIDATPLADGVAEPTNNFEPREPRYRLRDRNTLFSRRHPAKTPRELHELVANKGVQFIYNPLLTGLLYRSGALDAKVA